MKKKRQNLRSNLAGVLQRNEKIRTELLGKQQALKERDTLRMAVKQDLARRSAELELRNVQSSRRCPGRRRISSGAAREV